MKNQFFISKLYISKFELPENQPLMVSRGLKILGVGMFLAITSCATRSTPPAQVINASQVPAYAQTATPPVAAAAASANATPTTAKLAAVTNDDEVQTTSSNTASTPPATVATAPATSTSPQVAGGATKTAGVAATGGNAANQSGWKMPTAGTLGAYSVSSKGVDITGSEDQPIVAVAAGKVLYSGSGLKGYGNLIIIRHDNAYLSAYAYNKSNSVKEGVMVKQGQQIATMGRSKDSNQAMLHFEVRKNGKPVDPHTMIGN